MKKGTVQNLGEKNPEIYISLIGRPNALVPFYWSPRHQNEPISNVVLFLFLFSEHFAVPFAETKHLSLKLGPVYVLYSKYRKYTCTTSLKPILVQHALRSF